MKKGIDVSFAQGNVNWSAVKNNVDFVIIRAGFGREVSQTDSQFANNYTGCKSNGIPVGAYWYSYAESVEDAVLEAKACLEVLKGKTFDYPIFYDMEEQSQKEKGKEFCTAVANAFLSTVEKAGYWVGLYASKSFLEDYIDIATRKRYAVWLAHYATSTTYKDGYGMWQWCDNGNIDGIEGNVDLDHCYIDYPTLIKQRGLNGFAKPTAPPVQSQKPITYTVQWGDTLSRIARNNNTTVQKLCQLNGITNPDKIYAGKVLIIK